MLLNPRQGRGSTVLTPEDVGDESTFDLVKSTEFLSCEKWLSSPLIDIVEELNLPIGEIEKLKNVAAGKLAPPFLPAVSLTNGPCFSFGSLTLDHALSGILRPGQLVEIWGKAGAGKSQLALQICSTLDSAYISTEGSVPTERLVEMSGGDTADNCLIQLCTSVESLVKCVMKELPLLLAQKGGVKVVALDSIAAPFRTGEMVDGVQRARIIRSIGQQLKHLAVQWGLCVVVVNQATDVPGQGPQPALGLTWGYLVNSRVRIARAEGQWRRVTVDKSGAVRSGTGVDVTISSTGIS
eukprot:sb/3467474/